MTTQAATTTYAIDAAHSSAEFAVKHMMVSTVRGRFAHVEGTIVYDEENIAGSSVEASIDVSSIHSGVEMRDNDLRSANFFDLANFPVIRFRSTSVEKAGDDRFRIGGDLTIKDVTRAVVLDAELEGRGVDFAGEEIIGFTATASLNRKDFGLTYNAVLETGALVVADRVNITLHIEAKAA